MLRLTGHGFGHGHGMSQYGAQGAALKGLTHRQILAFYYPGTTLGTTTGSIRVLISADSDGDVRVLPSAGLRVREVGSGATYALPTSGITTWRLRTVSGRTSHRVRQRHLARLQARGQAALRASRSSTARGTVALRVAGATRTYRGTMRLSEGHTVNVLSMDDYVKGVVPREMPASWDSRRRALPGGGRADVRRLRPRRAPHPLLPDL